MDEFEWLVMSDGFEELMHTKGCARVHAMIAPDNAGSVVWFNCDPMVKAYKIAKATRQMIEEILFE
jgi:hypothetical protein